jgi:hypothetical protein
VIKEAFGQSYRLYHDISREQAKKRFQWPWYLWETPAQHHYRAKVLMHIGSELGHLRGRKSMILAQL